jgi:hypothetical protein
MAGSPEPGGRAVSRISVALATWNGTRYLEAQLRSLLAQTLRPDEIVLRDDGSDDETLALARGILEGQGIRLDLASNPTRLGSTGNFEAALRACTGDVVFFCDQDDVWHPDKIRVLEKALREHPEAGWAFCDLRLVDSGLVPLGGTMWDKIGFTPTLRGIYEQDPLEALLRRPLVTGAAMAVRRELALLATPFPAGWVHDQWISLILTSLGRPGRAIDTCLVDYRVHSAQQIGTKANGPIARIRAILAARQETYFHHARRFGALSESARLAGAPAESVAHVVRTARHHLARGSIPSLGLAGGLMTILSEAREGRYVYSANPNLSWFKDLLRLRPGRRSSDLDVNTFLRPGDHSPGNAPG